MILNEKSSCSEIRQKENKQINSCRIFIIKNQIIIATGYEDGIEILNIVKYNAVISKLNIENLRKIYVQGI